MPLSVRTGSAADLPAGLVAVGVPVVAGEGGPELLEMLPGRSGGDGTGEGGPAGGDGIAGARLPGPDELRALPRAGFSAKVGQSFVLRPQAGRPPLVLLGLGDRDGLDVERWRRAAASLVRAGGEGGTAAMVIPSRPPRRGRGAEIGAAEIGAAVAEGAVLAAYRFDGYRTTRRSPAIDALVLVQPGEARSAGLTSGAERGSVTAGAVSFARDLINTPPSDLAPAKLAELLVEHLRARPGTTVEVWDEVRISQERLGGLLGVSRGSLEPPRLVRATYDPGASSGTGGDPPPHIVLVGKGITFDSGGLSLKSADGMTTMKTDMSGAAIVMGALAACADLGARTKVTAIAPISENMPGARAVKPGDVLTIRNGSTIEVLNTDAEGRLVLADALSLAAEIDPPPAAVIDVATLTGAATVALGTGIGALFGSDDALIDRVRRAGDLAGERLWPMPLPEDYAEHIESEVADMKNVGRPGQAGAISAALLLLRFTGGLPWAHLDIAGPGRSAESSGYLSKGGTAFGLRTLVALADSYS